MKGILQMYDVDSTVGYDRYEQELRDRSKSLGRDLADSLSERNRSRSPVSKSALGLGGPESQPNLIKIGGTLPPNFD